jgi:hypothetical protein
VLPHNPLVTHETDARHLRDPAFLGGALRYRVARLLFTLQLRLRRWGLVLCLCRAAGARVAAALPLGQGQSHTHTDS